jgi:hypothetical protein
MSSASIRKARFLRRTSAVQLYYLSPDIGEQENVEAKNLEVVRRLTALLEKYVADGRSTSGKPQSNTGKVNIHGRGNQSDGD